MSGLLAQLGVAEETGWGVAATPSRFLEFTSESITATYGRVESNGLRAGRLYRSQERFTTYPEGAGGDVELEVVSKGMGVLLKHMLGAIATSGDATVGYTHTATPGPLTGQGLTVQVGRPFYDGSAVQPFTYVGGKITEWELANSAQENLTLKLTMDFADEVTATGLAAASYPTGLETFSWVGGSVTIAGTQFDVSEASVSGNNNAKTDRRYLRNNPRKKEPVGNDYREGEFSLTADFTDLAQRNRVAAATAAGALATIVLTWQGGTPFTGAVLPSLTATILGRFDTFEANVGGPESVEQKLGGVYLGPSAISLAYVTADVTA